MKIREKTFGKLLEMIRDKNRKKKLLFMMYDEGIIKRFRQSPASAKHHDSYNGGLINHSVFVTLKMMHDMHLYPNDVTIDKVVTTGLFHDLGKIGTKTEHLYIPLEGEGPPYTVNEKITQIPHEVRSVWILNEFDIKLSEDEYQAILYHGGMYMNSGKDIKNKELPLTLLLHHADMYVSHVLARMNRRNLVEKQLLNILR